MHSNRLHTDPAFFACIHEGASAFFLKTKLRFPALRLDAFFQKKLLYFRIIAMLTGLAAAGNAAAAGITIEFNPLVCSGTTLAELYYSDLTGTPLPDEYTIDYDAAAEAQGFTDVAYTALPLSPILLTVPAGAAPGVYNAVIKVNNSSLDDESDPVPFTVTILPVPALTLSITGPFTVLCGDEITVTVAVGSGFTDITGLQYSINWDETQLLYLNASATQIGGAGGDPFLGDLNVLDGELLYSWASPSGGQNLADGAVLLTITFQALAGSGNATVDMTGTPLPMEAANSDFCTATIDVQNNTDISFTSPSMTLSATAPSSVACGSTVEVTIAVVNGFTDVSALQYSVNWDETQLAYVSASPVQVGGPGGDPFLGEGNVINGELTYSWLAPSGSENLPDGAVLLTLTFTAITSSGNATVDITGSPLPLEMANGNFCVGTVDVQNNVDIDLGPLEVTLVLGDNTACENETMLELTGGLPPGGTYSGTAVSGMNFDPSAAGNGVHIITYSVTDVNGCSNSATDVITVNIPPDVTCPPNLTVCIGAAAFPLTEGTPSGGTFSGTGVSGGNFDPVAAGPGVHTITYTATDGNGCTGTCSFDITVEDTENPVVTCPPALPPQNADANCQFTLNGTALDATTTDDCVVISLLNDYNGNPSLDGAVFTVGVTTVTWTATDIGGNTATCTVEVTVLDVTPPAIVCPAGLTVDTDPGNCDAVVNGLSATTTDNCPVTVTWTVTAGPALAGAGTSTAADISGAVFALGTTTVEYLVTDAGGNTATCSFSVTVEDNEMFTVTPLPPGLVTFQDTFDVVNAPGTCSQDVSWYRPSFLTHIATDNCPDMFTITEGVAEVNGTPDPDFFTDNGVTPYPYDFTNPLHQVTPVSAAFPVGTTVIPYYFIDSHQDTVTIVVVVNVEETEPPLAACVPDVILLPLDGTGNAVLTPNMVDNGSSDNCGIASISVAPSAFTCADAAVNQVVTLTVTDFAGNTATCTATVDVVDNLMPVLLCPGDRLLSAGVNCDTFDLTLGMVPETDLNDLEPGEYFDNSGACGAGQYTVTYSVDGGPFNPIAGLPAQLFGTGVFTVTIQVAPASGTPATCSFTVTVEDQSPPVTNNCPNPPPVNANTGGCIAVVNWTPPAFTDNCPGNILVTSTHAPGSFFFFDTTLVTYTAIDAAGNVGICTFNVVVNDVQPPVAKCKDITASLDANGVVTVSPAQVDNNSTDNCFYNYVTADSVYNCTDKGPNPYTLTIVDAGGNTSSATCTVTVTDTIPGIKDPLIVNCNDAAPAAVNLDTACSGTLDAVLYALNFTVTDNTLNSTPPCPLSFDVDVDGSGFVPVYQWNCADVGSNTVTFRATDVFGNTAVCTKMVTVNDVTPPVIVNAGLIAPPVLTVECSDYDPNDFAALGQITLADVTDACDDNCNKELSIEFSDVATAGACDNAFAVTRTWKVSDSAGNATTHVQTISVLDTQAPTFNVATTLINLTANNYDEFPACLAPFTIQLNNSDISDNCTPSQLSFFDIFYEIQFPAGSIPTTPAGNGSVTENFPIGTSTVIFTVEDPCGNSAQITFTVTVNDADGPVINEPFGAVFGNLQKVCDSTITILGATGNCGNSFSWYRPFRADGNFLDCSSHNVTESISDPTVQSAINGSAPFVYTNPPFFNIHPTTFFPVGETTISYTATDEFDNTSVCTFTVKVLDTQAPDVNCPADQNLSISSACSGTATVPDYLNGAQVTDNCLDNIVLTQDPPAGTPLSDLVDTVKAGKTFTVKIKATDGEANNLADSCTFTVTLFDGEAPVPDLPVLPPIVSLCGVDTVDAPSASDCDGNMLVTVYGTPSVPVLGILPPLMPGGPPRYIIPIGNYAITWSYTDPQNNTTTQLQSVQVLPDVNPPLALCKAPFSVNLSIAGEYVLSIAEIDNGSTDPENCGPLTLNITPSVLTCANLNTPVNVTLLAMDAAGNIALCSTAVSVQDVTPPILPPIPANVTLEACALIPPPASLMAADVCDANVAVTFKQDTVDFVNAFQYTLRRSWTATDDSGNSSTGTQTLAISDTQAPVFIASTPNSLVVFTDANSLLCEDTVQIDIRPFVKECDSLSLIITNNRTGQGALYSEILAVGAYSLVFTAQDGSGHSATHSIAIEVRDGTNPIAACINGVSVSLQPSGSVIIVPANVNASSSDNCTASDDLMLSIQRLDPPGPASNSITYTCADADGVTKHPVRLRVKDEAGNESTCETYIVVQDNVFPVITSCPPDRTVHCDEDLSPAAQGTATATDNCTVSVVEFSDSTASGTGNICTVIFRSWRVLDQANNLSTCLQKLSIRDTIKPVLSFQPPDITVNCFQGLPAPAPVTATDNCAQSVPVLIQQDTIDQAAGNCGLYTYTVTRTYTATDACGNVETYTQHIRVVDNEAPLFAGLPDTLAFKTADFPPNQTCTVPVSLDVAQYISDCQPFDLITVTNNAQQGNGGTVISGNYTAGAYTIVFTGTDACGNADMDTVFLNVMDNSIPTAVCNDNVVIALGSNGQASLSPEDIDLGSSDNCGIDTMYLSVSTFDCNNLGINAVTLTVLDPSGNSNTCTVNVEVTPGTGGGTGFTLTVSGSPESYFGADDGSVSAVATGGSGQFTFTWSNGATTPDISGLPAGIYAVTVVDTAGGCARKDTAVVDAGAKITLSPGEGSGCQGQTISIPVTADNFFDVTGFAFTVHVDVDSVGAILGVTGGSVHPALAGGFSANVLAGNNLGVTWSDTSLTLPGNTVLFGIDIKLGTAAIGSASPVAITGTPVNILFTQDSSGANVAAIIVVENDTIRINCALGDNIDIGGDIQTWRAPTQPVPGVDVSLSGDATANQTTGAPGTYLFGVQNNTNTIVKCNKVTAGNEGLTGADVLLIKRHALNLQLLTSPYQFVAADVSGDGNLSLVDYARIQQVALALKDHITGSPDWKFIPKSYVFPSPNPLILPFPDSISHLPATASFLDDDFVAVRMGDVNGSIVPTFTSDDVYDRSESFRFRIEDRSFKAGETIEVPFRASGFGQRSGYQMTVQFDPGVFDLAGIAPGVLPDMSETNFGRLYAGEGLLTTLWVNAVPLTIADGEILFTLTFKVLRSGASMADLLHPVSYLTRAEGYDSEGNNMPVEFEFLRAQTGAEVAVFALYQNRPNPFNDNTVISFRLPETGGAVLRFFDASGRLVKTVTGDFEKGFHELSFRREELGGPGIYYYELSTAKNSERKRLIVVD